MNIQKKWLILVLITMVVFGSNASIAQEEPPTLRDLAAANEFYIGAAVYTYHLDDALHRDTFAHEFNMLTPEHEAKACQIQTGPGQFDFTRFDELVHFAEANDMVIRGHALVWHQCEATWIENGEFSRDEAIDLLRVYISTVVGRYRGRIAIWDVINEGVADNGSGLRDTPWRRLIGDDYIELAFQFAHEADPDAVLFYNDYGAEGINRKSDAIYELVSDFVERDIPIHGVGLQGHITVGDTAPGGSITPQLLGENIERIGALGLQVQITELDIKYLGETTDDILQDQAADYYRITETCLNSEYCNALIVWGVADHFSWLRQPEYYDNPTVQPLLFDSEYEPKPAYFAILDLLARRAGEPPILTDDVLSAMIGDQIVRADIPDPTKSDPTQLSPDSVTGAVYYAPFPLSITVDGEASDWENVPRVTIDNGPLLPSDHDTSMTFAVAADNLNLYFLADVVDSAVVYGIHEPVVAWYEEDSIEFYVNATGDPDLTQYEDGIVQLGFMAANLTQPDAPIVGGYNSDTIPMTVVVVETDTGYRVEASVPLITDVWTIEPAHLGEIGFQVHLNGSSSTDRDTKLIWSIYDTRDQSWTNPSLFGSLIFWNTEE